MAVGKALSATAQNVNWLLANFTDNDVFVEQTIAVSSDGLLMAASSSLDEPRTTAWRPSSRGCAACPKVEPG